MPFVLDICFNNLGGPGSQGALNTQQNGISFYNRNQGVHFHTLRANEFMYQDDLPNYSKIGVPAGATGPLYNVTTSKDDITMYVTDTTLVERLKFSGKQPRAIGSRMLLGLNQVATGPDGEPRYGVIWTDSRDLDISGVTGGQGRDEPGATGATGKDAPFFYENLSLTELKNSSGAMAADNNHIFFEGFVAGMDTIVREIKIRVKSGQAVVGNTTPPPGKPQGVQYLELAIYNSREQITGAAGAAGTAQYKPSTRNGRAIAVTVNPIDNQFVTFDYYSFTPAEPPTLTAGEVYFIALKQDYGDKNYIANNHLTFWGDPDNDGGDSIVNTGSILWKTDSNFFENGGGLPPSVTSLAISPNVLAGIWFQIYGFPSGSSFGPTGAQGLLGLTGPTGAQGEQGITGSTGPTGVQGSQGEIGAILGGVGMLDTWFVSQEIQDSGYIKFEQTTGDWLGAIRGAGNQMTFSGNDEFLFPKPGIYLLNCSFQIRFNSTSGSQQNDQHVRIDYTNNGGTSWTEGIAYIYAEKGGQNLPTELTQTFTAKVNINVSSPATDVKVRFYYFEQTGISNPSNAYIVDGSSNSWIDFTRAALPGEAGPTGAQGTSVTGPTGAQGEKGDRGIPGLTGGEVYANTIYQAWDLANTSLAPNIVGEQEEDFIYYHGFICNTTGVYKKLQVKVNQIIGTPNYLVNLEAVIYNSFGNNLGEGANGFNVPYLALTDNTSSNNSFTELNNINRKSGALVTLNLQNTGQNYDGSENLIDNKGVYLEKDKIYWVAVRWNNPQNITTFNLLTAKGADWSLDASGSSFTKKTKHIYPFASFPQNASVPGQYEPIPDISGAGFWFRLSGDDVPAGPQGRTGAQGVDGITGPTGPQGVQGFTGPTGSQGATGDKGIVGDVNIWYQSWDPNVKAMNEFGANSENVVYYHAFIAQQTGVYTNIKVRCASKNSGVCTLYAGVYSSSPSVQQPYPVQRLNNIGTPNQVIPDSNYFVDVNIGNVTLERNKIYFVAIKWTGATAAFYATAKKAKWWQYISTSTYSSAGVPPGDLDEGDTSESAAGGFWFTIYGPQTAAGASAGPAGATGAQGLEGAPGVTGMTGVTGAQGLPGSVGSASSLLRLRLENTFDTTANNYVDIPYSITPVLQVGTLWDLADGAHIGVTQPIRAFITYGGTIFTPFNPVATNQNSFMRLSYKPSGGNWAFIGGTKVAFGSTAATRMNGSGGDITGNAYSAYGSHIMLLNPGDKIKVQVHSYSGIPKLLGLDGTGGTNYGDTYIQVIDMLGGEAGPTGLQGLTGAQGFSGTGATGAQGLAGITGAQGPQGVIGEAITGAQGSVGPQGAQGFTGITGAQGLQGQSITGATGAQGSVGAQIIEKTYNITVPGPSKYFVDGVQQDTIYLFRGHRYNFTLDANTNGHPFVIQQTTSGNNNTNSYGGNAYNFGITPNLPISPYNPPTSFEFIVPYNSPDTLYYVCQVHPGMGGTIVIKDFTPGDLLGASGAQGDVGVQGAQGFTGLTGAQGVQGIIGPTGAQGVQGIIGPTGAQGIDGEAITGSQGSQGFTGVTGAQGIQGVIGPTGAQGVQGIIGPTGAQGIDGEAITGAQGSQGIIGPTGAQGPQGIDGEAITGAQGAIGSQGPTGAQGPQGIDGEAITGAQGSIGPTGAQGFTGVTGSQGAQGVIGEAITGAQGAIGPQGSDGNFGGASFDYHTQTPAGTGAPDSPGGILFNNNTQSSSTFINIDDTDDGGNSIVQFMTTLSTVSNPTLGYVRISNKLDPGQFLLFQITAIEPLPSGSNDYYKLTVANQSLSTNNPFSNDEDVIISFVAHGNRGDIGPTGAQGLAVTGPQGAAGPQGLQGLPGSASAAFRACLDISSIEHDQIQGNAQIPGEIEIPLVPSSNSPTSYVDLKYDKISYNDSNFSLNTSTGVITILKQMKAMITYSTSFRINNNSQAVFFQKLQVDTGSGFSDVENSGFSAAHDAASYRKSTSTGVMIMDLNINHKIKIRIAAGRFSNMGGNDSCFATKDSSIQIVDLFGGQIGPTGAQGVQGIIGPTGSQGLAGAQGDIGPTGAQGPLAATGSQGPQGIIGPTGAQGVQGIIGPTGSQGGGGDQGDDGPTGSQGPEGPTGSQGVQGKPGVTGPVGPQGEPGRPGDPGNGGPTGPQGPDGDTGAQGIAGPGYKGHATYTFLLDLSGAPTQFDSEGKPPSFVNNSNSGPTTDLNTLEFLQISGTHLLNMKFPSFPVVYGSQGTTTPAVNYRKAHNTYFGYLIPNDGELLGFSLEFIAFPREGVFYVFCYDPTGYDPGSNVGGSVVWSERLKTGEEPFGSGTINLEYKVPVKSNTYLFACQYIDGIGVPARGPAHITAYVRFT